MGSSVGRELKKRRERSWRVAQAEVMEDERASLALEHDFDVSVELVESLGGEADAEVVGGDLFELVGLVEDDGGGFGEDAGVGGIGGLLLDGEVGEEEVVVDDDDVGFERFAAHGGDEAVLPVGAGLAEAGFGAGV